MKELEDLIAAAREVNKLKESDGFHMRQHVLSELDFALEAFDKKGKSLGKQYVKEVEQLKEMGYSDHTC